MKVDDFPLIRVCLVVSGWNRWTGSSCSAAMQEGAARYPPEEGEILGRKLFHRLSTVSTGDDIGTIPSSVSWFPSVGPIDAAATIVSGISCNCQTHTSYAIWSYRCYNRTTVFESGAAHSAESGTRGATVGMRAIRTIVSTECGVGATRQRQVRFDHDDHHHRCQRQRTGQNWFRMWWGGRGSRSRSQSRWNRCHRCRR